VGDLVEVLTPELASVPAVSSGHSGHARPVERALSSTPLAEVLGRESVPVEAHFLDDLGAGAAPPAPAAAELSPRPPALTGRTPE
jgi:hypothetical protein